MAWDLRPTLGIGIPSLIIALIGYGGHAFVFHKYLTIHQQLWFQFCLSCLWVSYIIAIYQDPGSPPPNFKPLKGQWRRYCHKCKLYKPERTHHCKKCRKCVLKMDHHCPWLANCVGHGNMPHFLRFLILVDYTNGFALMQLVKRLYAFWRDRNLPIYLISKVELVAVIALAPMSFLVFITVGLMTIRWFYQILFTGRTQIESWEYERIEAQIGTKRFWNAIQRNYKALYGKDLKSVTSWSTAHRLIQNSMDEEVSPFFTMDDLLFPYDINPWENLVQVFGYPWSWVCFWGKPLGNGISFQKNEFFDPTGEDELSSLPWPPDSGDDDIITKQRVDESHETLRNRGITHEWSNNYGERLSDFGVDIETESEICTSAQIHE